MVVLFWDASPIRLGGVAENLLTMICVSVFRPPSFRGEDCRPQLRNKPMGSQRLDLKSEQFHLGRSAGKVTTTTLFFGLSCSPCGSNNAQPLTALHSC